MKWEKAEAQDPKTLIPEGPYLAKVVAAKAETSAAGNQMITLTFKILEGEHAGQKLRKWLVYIPSKPKAVWAFRTQLANMQIGDAFLDDDPEVEDVAEACLTAEALLVVVHEQYEGNLAAKVNWIDEKPATPPAGQKAVDEPF